MDLTSIDDFKSKKPGPFNIYRYDAQLAIAFQADCEDLLQKFKQLQNCSFATFVEVWKQTCFISVFEGQQYILMLQTFLENCFFIAKKFLFSTDPYIQTGGVYILYALYYKQPIKEWVKIRLTRAEADKMVEIVEVHKSYNSLDLVFIYHKMRKDGAFQYCALVQPVGLEARFLRRYDLSNEELQRTSSTNDPLRKFKELMEEDPDLVQLEETDEEYQKLVNKYKVKNEKLFVFPTQIGQELKRAYSNVFNIDLEDDEERARLKEVKSRAMSNMNATYRGEKAVLTAASLEAPSTSK